MRYQHHYKNNPRFKRKQKIRRNNPMRFKRLGFDQEPPHLTGMWFMLPDGDDFRVGHIHAIWGADWVVEYELEGGIRGEMDVDEFLDQAVMEDANDIERLHDILDQAAKIRTDLDDDVVWEFDSGRAAESASFEKTTASVVERYTEAPAVIATRHLREAAYYLAQGDRLAFFALHNATEALKGRVFSFPKTAFNKENPSELLNQMVRVLSKAVDSAEGQGRQGLEEALNEVRGLTKTVQDAWTQRKTE